MGELAALEDMCEPIEPSLQKRYNEHRFYGENTGEELDPVLVAKACKDELERFQKMKVFPTGPKDRSNARKDCESQMGSD
jgi:hypothetical protein